MRGLVLCVTLSICAIAHAQYFPATNIPFTQYGNLLNTPLSGGFTAPQFSDIDMNADGLNDLYVFDRGAWVSMVFIRDIADGSLKYDPEFETHFPLLQDWALIRDYNADGLPDIFTYSLGSTAVYKGILVDGDIYFDLEKPELIYTDGPVSTALYTSRTDIPSIDDIDSDGDLDILSFSLSNATIRFYQNTSVESGFGTDSLIFELPEFCWGELYEEASCDGATLFISCKGGDENSSFTKEALHVGSTIVTFDKDGDGDKDAVIGDNTCNNLVYYQNGGSSAYAQMIWRDSEFPSSTLSFSMPTFPAAFMTDADNDGDQDLIATTNDHLLGSNMQQVWLYENLNTNDTFDLAYAADTFLVSEMVDAGMYSKPIFFDHNDDGLQDILIGVGSSLGKDEILRHGLWLYENTGTSATPSFELITTNYAGMNAYPVSQLSPAPGDPDNDNDTDLLIGLSDGTLCFLENTAGAGTAAVYATPVFAWQGIDVGQLANPAFIDIEEDGKPDLVIGEQNGNLNYYHNTGTVSEPLYTLENEIWGGVDVRKPGYITGYSVPFIYRNENDSLYLLVGSQSGYVFEFNEIEDALLGEFYERDTNYLAWYPGTYAALWGADITNDGVMEFITGTIRGGIQIFSRDNGIPITELTPVISVDVYPNPSTDMITVNWQGNGDHTATIEILDMQGRTLYTEVCLGRSHTIKLPSTWGQGVYVIRVQTSDGSGASTFIKQ